MSVFPQYADRMSERYSAMRRIDGTPVSWEEGYVPLFARRGPDHARRALERFHDTLTGARKRVREEQIKQLLDAQPTWDLLYRLPLGKAMSIRKLVESEPRVVLLGQAGAGKTTALQSLAVDPPAARRDRNMLVLLVNLPEVPNLGQASLPDYLAQDAQQRFSLSLSPESFQQALVEGLVVIGLDGLDEVSGQQERVLAIKQIESWVSEFPNCHYVIAARASGYDAALSGDAFVHYGLVPWDEVMVDDVDGAWSQALASWEVGEPDRPHLVQNILAARALESLCIESGVEAAWAEMGEHLDAGAWRDTLSFALRFLARSHSDLFEGLMTRLLTAEGGPAWEPVLRRRLLIAASALQGAPDGLAVRQRTVDQLVVWMTDAEAVGRADAVYALLQLTGDSYATERAIEVAQDDTRDVWSREAALLVLGRLGSARVSETIDLLAAHMDDGQAEARLQLAAATSMGVLGSSSALSQTERGLIVERLLGCVRSSDAGIDLRVAASEALSAIHSVAPDATVLDTFVALARAEGSEKTPPYSVQIAAARALSQVLVDGAQPEFTEQMLALARDVEVSSEVRTALAEALGFRGKADAAAQVLIGIAQDAKVYPPGHKAALEALGRVGYADQAILDQILKIAQTKDRKVKDFERLAAAYALGGLGHADLAVQHMLMLIADKSLFRSTRNDALGYVGRLGSTGEADLDAAVVAVLQIWVNEENTTEDVRENAIESLRMLRAGQDEVIRDLVSVIQNKSTYPRVRRVAAAQLGRFPVEQKDMVVDALSPVFYDPDEKSDLLRVPIARMLFLWGEDEQALAYLRLAAEQSYMAQVRYNASMVLLEIGEVGVGTVELLRLAQNPEIADLIRCDAARALGLWMTGNEDVALAMAGITRDAALEPNVRDAAYSSLRAITA